MPSDKKVADIVTKVRDNFRSFGGGKANPCNPLSVAIKDEPPQFAAGVSIEEVVRFVAKELSR